MQEVIAKKCSSSKLSFIILLIILVCVTIIGSCLFAVSVGKEDISVSLMYCGLSLIVFGVFTLVILTYSFMCYKHLPEVLVSYTDGIFTFPKGINCRAQDITDIKYSMKPVLGYNKSHYDFSCGNLKIITADKKIKLSCVADPFGVYNRMTEIINENKIFDLTENK